LAECMKNPPRSCLARSAWHRKRHSRNGLHRGHTIPRGGICSRKGTSLVSSGGFLAFRSGRAPTPQNRYCMLKRRRYKKDVIAIHST
jgi:hypothetical protein